MTVTSSLSAFKANVESVHRLMNFDRDVLSHAIEAIEGLQERLERQGIENPALDATRTLEILRGFRSHDSLRPRYQTIFNQAVVLLVSYFGSAVHDVFRAGVDGALDSAREWPLLKEQFRVTFGELKEANYDLRSRAADLLVNAKDISFQDMKSIGRAFKENLGVDVERTAGVNDIILAQACRHVIVHAGGVADEGLIRQLSGAHPRTLKPRISLRERIQFSPEEVGRAAEAMTDYLESLEARTQAAIGS